MGFLEPIPHGYQGMTEVCGETKVVCGLSTAQRCSSNLLVQESTVAGLRLFFVFKTFYKDFLAIMETGCFDRNRSIN